MPNPSPADDAGLDIDYDLQLAKIQAASAGVTPSVVREITPSPVTGEVIETTSVEFLGQRFRIAEKIGLMPLLKFSAFADVDINDSRALGAMYAMLRDCIYPGTPGCGTCEFCTSNDERSCKSYDHGDWAAFEDHAMTTRADADDLFKVIQDVMELISGRPTPQPSTSSTGRRNSRAGSTATSSGKRAGGSKR